MSNKDTPQPFGRCKIVPGCGCPCTQSQRGRSHRRRAAQREEFTAADGLALQAILERKAGQGKTLQQLSEEEPSDR